jgi:hypothetical protein
MTTRTRLASLLLLFCIPMLLGIDCKEPPFTFYIRVVDQQNQPLDSVTVTYWTDGGPWNPSGGYGSKLTDSEGYAKLPSSARKEFGSLTGRGFKPRVVGFWADSSYQMVPLPMEARSLGSVDGDDFFFRKVYLISLSDDGTYRCYTMGNPATLVFQSFIGPSMRDRRVIAEENRLWCYDYNGNYLEIDVTDPAQPVARYRFQLDAGTRLIASDDSVLVIKGSSGNIKIYTTDHVSHPAYKYTITSSGWSNVALRGNRLLLVNSEGWFGYDVSSRIEPTLLFADRTFRQEYPIYLDTLMFLETNQSAPDTTNLRVFDIRDPSDPVYLRDIAIPLDEVDLIVDDLRYYGELYWLGWSLPDVSYTYYATAAQSFDEFEIVGAISWRSGDWRSSSPQAAWGDYFVQDNTLYRWRARAE